MAFAKTTYPTMTENGKVYYLYTVQKSEGLYAISQRFGVPQAIILEANPGIKAEGLVLGQQIKVPKNATEKNTKTVQVGKNQHVVKAKETLYGLSKKYNCTVDELLELNPWATHLTIGAVLQIPEKSKTKAQESNEESLPQTTAQAQPQVTNQTTEAGSKETKSKEKKNIWSWFTKKSKVETTSVEDTATVEEQDTTESTVDSLLLEDYAIAQKESNVKIAVLLPFMLDSLNRDATMDRFVEFYQGCLLAIDSLAKQGLSTQVFTYDIGKSEASLLQVLQDKQLQQVDMIIGPAYQNHVDMMSSYAYQHRIPTVIPFSSNVPNIKDNPYLFQVVTPQKELYVTVVKKCCYYLHDKEFIVIKPRMLAQHNKSEFTNALIEGLNHMAIPYTVISDQNIAQEVDSLAMLTTKECVVVMPSTHGVALNKLGEAMEQIKQSNVSLFGFPEWNSLGIDELYNKPLYCFSNYQTNFNNSEIIHFYNQIRNKFGVPKGIQQSPNFALFGFDICYFFLQQYSMHGKHFAKFMPLTETSGLQMNFLFQRVENGGYWNVGTVMQSINKQGINTL